MRQRDPRSGREVLPTQARKSTKVPQGGRMVSETIEDEVRAERAVQKRGRANRRKGARWERELVLRLREVWPEACRGIGQVRAGGEVPDIAGCYPFWIESKAGIRVNWRAAWEQVVGYLAGSKEGRYQVPVVIAKDDRSKPVVVMYLEDWEAMVRSGREP